MSKLRFIKNFFLKPNSTGAIVPSSPKLAIEMVKKIDNNNIDNIVEIGPGTGAITKFILDIAKKNQKRFFAVELNRDFYNYLTQSYPDLEIYNGNAVNLREIVSSLKLNSIDAVISGLPWAIFPEKLQISLLEAIVSVLRDGGYFSTFAYIQGMILPSGIKFRRLLKQYFSNVELSKTIWKNIPPAIVYHCKR